MKRSGARETAVIDDLDRQIIRALQVDPRAGFSVIGEVLGVSEQTVARRFRRMRADGLLRVIGMVDPRHLGQSEWLVRVTCRPGGTRPLADALARRDDVSWVTLSAGGSEIDCSVRSLSDEQRDDLLLQRLPATSQVLGLTAHAILHRFAGAYSGDWTGYGGEPLTPAQVTALQPAAPVPAAPVPAAPVPAAPVPAAPVPAASVPAAEPVTLQDDDAPLIAELARDGRASYATLAGATGWSQGRVTRRLAALFGAGVLYLDLDLATELLGFPTTAYLWLRVEPASLVAVGTELARHQEVPFVAAVTGPANLVATVICRDTEALYEYVATRIGATAGVRELEVSPTLRRIKQAGSRMDGGRLAPPAAGPPPARARAARAGAR
jgi:DNA-binding Lrp family transcriptional regulator